MRTLQDTLTSNKTDDVAFSNCFGSEQVVWFKGAKESKVFTRSSIIYGLPLKDQLMSLSIPDYEGCDYGLTFENDSSLDASRELNFAL